MTDQPSSNETRAYTPPSACKALTPLYDLAISILTRESKWRHTFAREIAPLPTDSIIDIGSGTGSLALMIHKIAPLANYLGIDPNSDAVRPGEEKGRACGV